MRNLITILIIILGALTFAEEIPNIIVTENPVREVNTINTLKSKEKAELNLNVKKITSERVIPYVNSQKRVIIFKIEELKRDEAFFLTDDNEIFNRKNKRVKIDERKFRFNDIDYGKNLVSFKFKELNRDLYLVRYKKESKKLVKLYKIAQEDIEYIEEIIGEITLVFTEKYLPFDIVNFNRSDRSLNNKGRIEIKEGKMISINPDIDTEIIIKDESGEVLETTKVIKGRTNLFLDRSRKGIYIKNGSSILNLGLGLERGNLLLQVKGTTDSSKIYKMILEVKNEDETYSSYKINIKPADYRFEIINNELNLDFSDDSKIYLTLEGEEIDEVVTRDRLLIDSKGINIRVGFKNNGIVKLINGENSFNIKLESEVLNKDKKDIKLIEVVGRAKKEELKGIPQGNYSGETELIIYIDL